LTTTEIHYWIHSATSARGTDNSTHHSDEHRAQTDHVQSSSAHRDVVVVDAARSAAAAAVHAGPTAYVLASVGTAASVGVSRGLTPHSTHFRDQCLQTITALIC